MNQLKKDVINWLLEKDNPPVRYLTLKHLLKDAKAAQESKTLLMDYHVTQGIIKHLQDFIDDDKPYHKYKGRYWQTIFLGHFTADGKDPSIEKLAEKILADRKWIWKQGGQCLTANLLAALTRLGFGDHPFVVDETERLARRIVSDKGITCEAMLYSTRSQCYMAIPKPLLLFSEIPLKKRSPVINKAGEILVNVLLDNEVYIYIHANRKEWQKILAKQPKRAELPEGQTVKAWISEQKEKFLETYGPGGHEEKKGWLKFGFPLYYNSDILEAMYALARLDIPMKPNLKKPLQIIKEKETAEGKWLMGNSLNGKMWVDVEEKGKASKWLTYFALYVLDHFEQ